MYSLASGVYQSYFAPPKLSILILGLDGSGKTALLERVKKGKKKMFPLSKIRPTLGQNLAKLDLCGCKCSLFDLSGAEKMRPLWERYYRDTDAIIYVVNSADPSLSNLEQSLIEFNQMCRNEVLQWKLSRGLPILIFANMLDVAYQEYDAIIERSNRCDENVSTRRGIRSAKSGEGVRAAMEYLVAHSKKYHLANNATEK
ncbi:adp-ribosylation factor-related protein [Thalassiosira pseudonana CCMP1335]|uniref:Adp-ribosylation factor-related protein n=1 Tax=Thalassiosira pseudonana TaxID=35128 RepID=B8C136_THAPS|nr:adp-ribosylation factor-related protein [Thalassiosira pseudonana CCMP1335]EED93171.1 adp-ribosylation factor-related protein [Thalassiosira pseudonana CCMP1335]